jgi:hypothetical protein
MKKTENSFGEDDILSAMKYLKTKNPLKATRDDAITLLEGMGTSAHMIAYDIVEKEMKPKSKGKKKS